MLYTLKLALAIFGVIFASFITIALLTSYWVAIFGGGPFLPTPKKAVKKILKEIGVKKGDVLYDIGAGDGRFLHYAEKLYGAKAIGFEIDPFVFFIGKLKQWIFGWKGELIRSNFRHYDLSDANIVICYMLPNTLIEYQKKFDKELKSGTLVASYTFHIGSWRPIKIIEKDTKTGIKKIFIYKVTKKSKKRITKKRISKRT